MNKYANYIFLFILCLSGYGHADPGDYIVLLWTQQNGYTIQKTVDVPWAGKKISLQPPAPQGEAWKANRECSVDSLTGAYISSTSWIAIPHSIEIAGVSVPISVQTTSWSRYFSRGNYDYWFRVISRNDGPHLSERSDCGEIGDISMYPISIDYSGLSLSFDVPRGLPVGVTHGSLIMGGGEENQYWTEANRATVMPESFLEQGIKNLRYDYSFYVRNTCRAELDNYTIDHGKLTYKQAQGSEKTISIGVSCTAASDVKIELSPIERTSLKNGRTAIDLGNGWESFIKLDGSDTLSETLRWEQPEKKYISVTSKLNNLKGKPGKLEGNIILIIQPL